MRDYLGDFLTPGGGENLKTPKGGKAQKAQKSPAKSENPQGGQGSKGSQGTFDTFDTSPPGGYSKIQGPPAASPGTVEPAAVDTSGPELTAGTDATTGRFCEQSTPEAALTDENPEMHDSALFDPPIVEVTFYDGRRIRIPQYSPAEGWMPPF